MSTTHPAGAYLLAGAGAATVIASVLVGLSARSSESAYQRAADQGQASAAAQASSAASSNATLSTVLTGAGLAALVGGAVWWWRGASSAPEGAR